jgi:hypothetical protein
MQHELSPTTAPGIVSAVQPDAGFPGQHSLVALSAAHAMSGCAKPNKLAQTRNMAVRRRNMR